MGPTARQAYAQNRVVLGQAPQGSSLGMANRSTSDATAMQVCSCAGGIHAALTTSRHRLLTGVEAYTASGLPDRQVCCSTAMLAAVCGFGATVRKGRPHREEGGCLGGKAGKQKCRGPVGVWTGHVEQFSQAAAHVSHTAG